MALTAYCKKCNREVSPGEVCPRCGTKLGKNAAHAAWCLERTPVRDWLCWNEIMRVLLPAGLAVLLAVLLAEWLSGGTEALEKLLGAGFLPTLAALLLCTVGIVGLVLALRGKELADYVVDRRGVHETRYLPHPTALKMLLRFRSPAAADAAGEDPPLVRLGEREIAWKDVARVQLWPEKCTILIYAPAWWLRIGLVCTPFTWEDAIGMIREKLGRKKKVLLPPSLVTAVPPASGKRKPAATAPPEIAEALEQLRQEEAAEQRQAETAEAFDLPEGL